MKKMEHIDAAKAEASRLGASFELINGGKHLIGVISFNGQCRKTSFSVSPSRLACYQTVKYVRKLVEEMRNCDTRKGNSKA